VTQWKIIDGLEQGDGSLRHYILRFLKFGDFERGEVRGGIETTKREIEEQGRWN